MMGGTAVEVDSWIGASFYTIKAICYNY